MRSRETFSFFIGGLFLLQMLILPSSAVGQHWPQFRGPDASGVVADNQELPESWSRSNNVAWRTEIPGLGWSSPVITNGLVVFTTVVSDGDVEFPEGGWYGGRA